jgi:glucose/mannose-6-phosphate isomerase
MPFDETVLETAESVAAHDPGNLLFELATAGAQVRVESARLAESAEDGPALPDDQAPRAVLVAVDPVAEPACGLLGALGFDAAPVLRCDGTVLPRWAGAADALLVASADGRHPRLAALVDQASRRGLLVVVVAPGDSMVAQSGRAVVHDVAVRHHRAARWTLLTPLVQAAVQLGIVPAAAAPWDRIADALDEIAEACQPSGDPYTNSAKQLATELAEATPVIVATGPLAAQAADTMMTSLALLACTAGAAFDLPDEVAAAAAVLTRTVGDGAGAVDFFRDRTEDEAARPRLIVIGDDPAVGLDFEAEGPLGTLAGARAARALQDIAARAGVRWSTVDVPTGTALARFAAASAFGDFTAAYLGIGLGCDPGAVRPGELPH